MAHYLNYACLCIWEQFWITVFKQIIKLELSITSHGYDSQQGSEGTGQEMLILFLLVYFDLFWFYLFQGFVILFFVLFFCFVLWDSFTLLLKLVLSELNAILPPQPHMCWDYEYKPLGNVNVNPNHLGGKGSTWQKWRGWKELSHHYATSCHLNTPWTGRTTW